MTNAAPRFSIPAPIGGWSLALLVVVYLLVGATGHLPWRGDDLTHLGPIHSILTHGSWLMPELAGEAFHDYPPLYYWVGALLARLLGGVLPIHDAARLASGIFTAVFLYWTGIAARRLYGEPAFAPAILLGIGSLGLVVHAHETQPLLAQLAGMAVCYAGLGRLAGQPATAGLEAGIGSGLAFLAGGLPGMLLTLPILLFAPLLCPSCRNRVVGGGVALGVATATLIGGSWLVAVAVLQPGELGLWWSDELAASLPHAYHLADFGTRAISARRRTVSSASPRAARSVRTRATSTRRSPIASARSPSAPTATTCPRPSTLPGTSTPRRPQTCRCSSVARTTQPRVAASSRATGTATPDRLGTTRAARRARATAATASRC